MVHKDTQCISGGRQKCTILVMNRMYRPLYFSFSLPWLSGIGMVLHVHTGPVVHCPPTSIGSVYHSIVQSMPVCASMIVLCQHCYSLPAGYRIMRCSRNSPLPPVLCIARHRHDWRGGESYALRAYSTTSLWTDRDVQISTFPSVWILNKSLVIRVWRVHHPVTFTSRRARGCKWYSQ
jgi:hypothetical protein